MIRSRIIPEAEQAHYWNVVQRCLTEFHGLAKPAATKKVHLLKEDVEGMPRKDAELFFHAEPVDVACRIAQKELDVVKVLDRYLAIRDRPEAGDR